MGGRGDPEFHPGEFHPGMIMDTLMGPGRFYELDRHLWMDLWRVPVFEALEDNGIEMRGFGPVWTFTIADAPRMPLFNLVLGGGRPGAVERGHLEEALDWTESLGADCRVPIRPEMGEAEGAAALLGGRGYEPEATQALLVRGTSAPGPADAEGIEVEEQREETEGFSDVLARGYGMEWTGHGFFIALPGRPGWRSYLALDSESGFSLGAATMMMHHQIAQLGFAASYEAERGRGVHRALIRRRVADAIEAGVESIFAIVEEPLDYPHEESPAAANLARAGFALRGIRTVWRPPEDLLAGEDDEDEDERDDDLDAGGDGFDGNHDFRLRE
jgi:hypothetical protein